MDVKEELLSCKSGKQVIYRGVRKKMRKHFINISARLRGKHISQHFIQRSLFTISKGKWKGFRRS